MKTYIKASVVSLALVVSGVLVSPSAQVQIQRGFSTVYNLTVQNLALFADGTAAAPSISFASDTGLGLFRVSAGIIGIGSEGGERLRLGATNLTLPSSRSLAWTSTSESSSAVDLILARDAANTLALRNGVNPQVFRVYNTFTDAANYERASILWTANQAQLISQAAGTGVLRPIGIVVGASFGVTDTGTPFTWNVNGSGHIVTNADNTYDIGGSATKPRLVHTGASTVAALPACVAATKQARYFVTDANATTFWTIVAGGGANNIVVTCDGTNWRIG